MTDNIIFTELELSNLAEQIQRSIDNTFEILTNPKSACNQYAENKAEAEGRLASRVALLDCIQDDLRLKAKVMILWRRKRGEA